MSALMLVATACGSEPVGLGSVVLPHPLLPVHEVYVVAHSPPDDPGAGTLGWIETLRAAQFPLVVLDDPAFHDDVWTQDMFRFALVREPAGERPVLIASPRNAETGVARADVLVKRDPTVSLVTVHMEGWSNLEGFGNFVVSPPIEGYPDGRVLYGTYGDHAPYQALLDLLSPTQAPAPIDLQFLDVGHTDEVFAFVSDPTAPRGFRVLVPDPRLALELLDAAPSAELPLYAGADRFGFALGSTDAIRKHPAVRGFNHDLALRLDGAVGVATALLDLQPDEIIGLPVLFHENADALTELVGAGALTPNMVNGTWVSRPDGRSLLALPDPQLRPEGAPLSDDPFVRATEARLPKNIDVVWVDAWRSLHVNGGELHCATSVRYRSAP